MDGELILNTVLVGREYEQKALQRAFDSKEAEMIAIYGRRRVGKTFLVREFFNKKHCLFFQVSGIHKAPSKLQLEEFKKEIERVFYSQQQYTRLQIPRNWMDALGMLTDAITIQGSTQKVILFFDEFPWMATSKSGLLQSLDYYWNRFWVSDPKIKLIICGSAASWIIKNILNNKGGLYNRVTLKIYLEPFSLYETKSYLKQKGIALDNIQILQLYLCIGGVPFYLKQVEKGLSAIQVINKLCFQKKGTLLDEFQNLFSSLFEHGEAHEEIIKFIASHREGMERSQIEAAVKYKGGRLTKRLKELEEAGFIMSFTPWGKERGTYYKVIDEYTLFYLYWIAPGSKSRITKEIDTKYWEIVSQTPAFRTWSGYAFEAVCYKHLNNIRKALAIPEGASATTWRYIPPRKSKESGTQIDLLFDRPDGIVNICEIKYCTTPYIVDKNYAKELQHKVQVYKKITKTQKQIFISMITLYPLKKTMYSEELIISEATLNDLYSIGSSHISGG